MKEKTASAKKGKITQAHSRSVIYAVEAQSRSLIYAVFQTLAAVISEVHSSSLLYAA